MFNLVCWTEVNSKFMQEKTAIFIFHFILFFQIALINNDQPNVLFFPKHSRYVRVNFARVKGSTTKYYVLLLSLLLCSILCIIIIIIIMFNVISHRAEILVSLVFAVRADFNQMSKVSQQYPLLGT